MFRANDLGRQGYAHPERHFLLELTHDPKELAPLILAAASVLLASYRQRELEIGMHKGLDKSDE